MINLPYFKLDKPDLSQVDKSQVFEKAEKAGDKINQLLKKLNEPKYLYWDEARYKEIPAGFTPEASWFLVRQLRNYFSQKTPIKTVSGNYFRWLKLSYLDEFLHKIDVSSGGQILASMEVMSAANKQKYISRGIMEEAIASSQLEGAHTTRQAAKQMILENRTPRNKDEQMILNNYHTMVKIDEDYKNQSLSETMLFELHRQLTKETIAREGQGRFRKDEDRIVVQGQIGPEQYVSHVPPNEDFVKQEIAKLMDYANDKNEESFLHPVIKAIWLHFWVGYLHPFIDGNGRLARALFYWYLLRKKYWTFMYLPISMVIKRAPVQYSMAYIYSEQDSDDATYFFDFHIRKIIQALNDFNNYVKTKITDNQEVDKMIEQGVHLSARQKYLIHYLISQSNAYTTITAHANLNNVSRQTAAKDIKELAEMGLVAGRRAGKYIRYQATNKLKRH